MAPFICPFYHSQVPLAKRLPWTVPGLEGNLSIPTFFLLPRAIPDYGSFGRTLEWIVLATGIDFPVLQWKTDSLR